MHVYNAWRHLRVSQSASGNRWFPPSVDHHTVELCMAWETNSPTNSLSWPTPDVYNIELVAHDDYQKHGLEVMLEAPKHLRQMPTPRLPHTSRSTPVPKQRYIPWFNQTSTSQGRHPHRWFQLSYIQLRLAARGLKGTLDHVILPWKQ